jgi:hypothetical protein
MDERRATSMASSIRTADAPQSPPGVSRHLFTASQAWKKQNALRRSNFFHLLANWLPDGQITYLRQFLSSPSAKNI